jgi:hypothetical protein
MARRPHKLFLPVLAAFLNAGLAASQAFAQLPPDPVPEPASAPAPAPETASADEEDPAEVIRITTDPRNPEAGYFLVYKLDDLLDIRACPGGPETCEKLIMARWDDVQDLQTHYQWLMAYLGAKVAGVLKKLTDGKGLGSAGKQYKTDANIEATREYYNRQFALERLLDPWKFQQRPRYCLSYQWRTWKPAKRFERFRGLLLRAINDEPIPRKAVYYM